MRYRPEIDGLRAFAVLAVILFHAGTPLTGGYVGVDVFFVISGYLITTIIADDLKAGRFSILRFYERRLRRILPALFFVTGACQLLAWFKLPPPAMASLTESTVWMVAFASNIYFWLHTGYFEGSAQLNPLLHTWTLAVEEQYYLIFPLLLMILAPLRRGWVLLTILLIAGASLVIAQWQSSASPASAFYLLPARGWELLMGSLIALTSTKFVRHHLVRSVVSIVGFTMIVGSMLLFTADTPSASVFTLIPTVGAALVIIGGDQGSIIGRILASKPAVGIGLISYSLYLWHHPVFAFYRLEYGSGDIPILHAVVLIGLIGLLSVLTWRFVERPFRDPKHLTCQSVFGLSVAGATAFLAFGAAGVATSGFTSRLSAEQRDFLAYFQNARPDQPYFKRIRFRELFRDECNFFDIEADMRGSPTKVARPSIVQHCYTRNADHRPAVMLWGDSHARQLSYGLIQNLPDWDVLQVTSHGCLANLDAPENRQDYCDYSNWFAAQTIERERPDVVIIGQNLGHRAEKMETLGKRLLSIGVRRVVFAGPTPHWLSDFYTVVAYNILPDHPRKTLTGLDQSVIAQDAALKVGFPANPDVRYFSIIDRMCDEQGCAVYYGDDIKSGLSSWDMGHLTPKASLAVGQALSAIVSER